MSGGPTAGGCACAGELLSLYRPQLEALLAGEGRSGLTASPLRSGTTAAAKARKKRSAARKEAESDYEARAPCLAWLLSNRRRPPGREAESMRMSPAKAVYDCCW